jgi:hypothetical protein
MSVIFYDEGEHPAGFIGFRVATTLGDAKSFSQAYFALSEYSYDQAYSLAHELNEQWRNNAKQITRRRRLSRQSRRGKPGYIATGLRGDILVEYRSNDKHATNVRPCFIVQHPGYGKGQLVFPILKHGFLKAYILAVDYYAEINKLTDQESAELISNPPDKSMFTDGLWLKLIDKDIFVTKKTIEQKINSQGQ